MGKTTHLKFSILAILFIVGLAASPAITHAATLYFSPSSGSYNVGDTLSAVIFVSSADQSMNAASGIVSFPQDELEVISLSKTGSIFTLWVQEPSFSNSAGTVTFEGIVLNPGFTGAAGKILTANFRAKAVGAASLNFSSGSVLANDGKGTNILTNLGAAQFSLGRAGQAAPQIAVPSAPQVSSPTHPDSNKSYNNKNPEFSWVLPDDVNGVSIYFGKSPTSNPGPLPDGLFASKSYENIDDGIWYFHIKMRNSAGWGPITHFKIQIDTQSPEPAEIIQPATTSQEIAITQVDVESPTVVEKKPGLLSAGTKAASFIVLAIVLVALLISLLLLLWYGWRVLSSMKIRVKKEVSEAEKALRVAFRLLRQNVQKQIKMLEDVKAKRKLTEEEEKIIKQFGQDLDEAEKFVRKEIKDIEKEIK